MIKEVKNYIEFLARQHRLLGHREHTPHFAYLNDEKDLRLPAEMGYPFVLFGHDGYQMTEDGSHLRWSVLLSVQTHVADTGDEREKNRAMNLCGRILLDILARATSMEEMTKHRFLRGISLGGATATPVENAGGSLYGWVIEFAITLPWCREPNTERWEDK